MNANFNRAAGALLAALLCPACSVSAATYYVDFAAGSDAGDGASPAAPFRHCPGDAAAGQTARTAILRPGDTVIFKGGVTYRGETIVCASGVAYDGNSAGTFGSGRAILNGGHDPAHPQCFFARAQSGLIFDHLEVAQWGGHGALPWAGHDAKYPGWGVYLDNCSSCTVKNCLFDDIGDWLNQADANGNHFGGVGVQVINSGRDIAIANNEFTRIGLAAIQLNAYQGSAPAVRDITIAGNNIHDSVVWGVNLVVNEPHGTLDAVTIAGNRFHDMWQYSPALWLGAARSWPHTDEIICFLGGTSGGKQVSPVTLGTVGRPIVIRGNFFYNDAPPSLTAGTACVFLTNWGGRVAVCDNIFANVLNHGEGAVYFQDGPGEGNPAPDYWVANNTFYDDDYAVMLRTVSAPPAAYALARGSVRIMNNVFYKANDDAAMSVTFGLDDYSRPTVLDYNIYRTGRPDRCIVHSYDPAPGGAQPAHGYRTLADLRAQGYERHGALADPGFVNLSFGLGARTSSNDFHLRPSSPARGAGSNLSGAPGAGSDFDGQPRPGAGNWDAGACQVR